MWTLIADQHAALCRGMCKRLPFGLIWLARTSFLDGPEHVFLLRNGTNDHEQPVVPIGPTRSNRVKTCLNSSDLEAKILNHLFRLFCS